MLLSPLIVECVMIFSMLGVLFAGSVQFEKILSPASVSAGVEICAAEISRVLSQVDEQCDKVSSPYGPAKIMVGTAENPGRLVKTPDTFRQPHRVMDGKTLLGILYVGFIKSGTEEHFDFIPTTAGVNRYCEVVTQALLAFYRVPSEELKSKQVVISVPMAYDKPHVRQLLANGWLIDKSVGKEIVLIDSTKTRDGVQVDADTEKWCQLKELQGLNIDSLPHLQKLRDDFSKYLTGYRGPSEPTKVSALRLYLTYTLPSA